MTDDAPSFRISQGEIARRHKAPALVEREGCRRLGGLAFAVAVAAVAVAAAVVVVSGGDDDVDAESSSGGLRGEKRRRKERHRTWEEEIADDPAFAHLKYGNGKGPVPGVRSWWRR